MTDADPAAPAARAAASAAQPQPFVLALEPLKREGADVPVGAVFRPRDAVERTALGARVRPATAHECAIAAV